MRRTALERRTPLRRKEWVRKKSRRLLAYDAEFRRAKRLVRQRSAGRCEFIEWIGSPGVGVACMYDAEHCHHIVLRSQGGTNDLDNLLDLCSMHHRWVHDHPEASYEGGYMRRRGQ